MANTYTSLHYHIVFITKNRQAFLVETIRERLFAYVGGIARENGMNALAIGAVADHVHLLVSIPASLAVSKAVQLVKGGSSHWLKETFPNMTDFAWQDGYAASQTFAATQAAIVV
jgi:putative transposase